MALPRDLLTQINEAHSLYLQLSYDFWVQYSLYTWKWWLLLVFLIAPWYLWWRLVDKKRLLEIWCYGVMTFVLVIAADAIGVAYGCWHYPIRLVPKFPHLLPVDTTVLPILYMLVYQCCPRWKAFILANVVMAAALAFIAEPITAWLGYYETLTWKYYYSFPLYILLATILKLILQTVIALQSGGRKQ